MFQEKVFHDSVAFSSSIQDVKLLVNESSTSSYLAVESSSGYHHSVSHSVYEQRIS